MSRYLNFLSHCVRRALLVLLALILLSAPGLAYAQQELNTYSVPSLNWYTMYGGVDFDTARTMTSDSSGNIYVVGSTDHGWQNTGMQPLHPFTPPYGSLARNMVIAKFDSAGKLIWHTYYGTSRGPTDGRSILIDGSGNLYIIGQSSGEWDGLTPKRAFHGPNKTEHYDPNHDVFILKLNNAGAYQWHTYYGSDKVEGEVQAVLESSGNIIIAGETEAPWAGLIPKRSFSGVTNFFALSVNSTGDYRWHTFYSLQQKGQVSIKEMQVDSAGFIYLTGSSTFDFTGIQPLRPINANGDILLMKMSNAGVLQWYTFYGGPSTEVSNAMVLNGGNVFLTGVSYKPWPGLNPLHPFNEDVLHNLFVLKLNSAGAYQWHTFYGEAGGNDIVVDTLGRILVYGVGFELPGLRPITPHNGDWDSMLMILDASGKYVSHAYYGTPLNGNIIDSGQEILLVGSKLYMLGWSGASWPAFSPPLHPSYSDTDTYLACISIVDKPSSATSTHLEVTANPWEMGRTITLTADIMSDGGVPFGGKVTFKDGAATLGTVDLLNGQAKLNITPNVLGTHMITAQYSGAPGFLPSQTPGAISLEIVKAKTVVTLVNQYDSSPYGVEAIFTVFVNAVNQNVYQPSGWVVLKEGTRVVGSSLLANGRADIRTSSLSVGNVSLTAEYLGAVVFAPSTSAALRYQVPKGTVSTTLAALPSEAVGYGSDLTLKANVSHSGSSSVKPDGTVIFQVNDQEIGSETLVNGTATVTLHTLPLGTHYATATYTGSDKFNPNNPLGSVISITQGVPHVTLEPEGGSAMNSGESKRFTVTVQGAYPDLIQPTGIVKLYEGTTDIATLELINGVATSDPLTLSDGAHSITATYGGDALYLYQTSRPAAVIVAGTPLYLPVLMR